MRYCSSSKKKVCDQKESVALHRREMNLVVMDGWYGLRGVCVCVCVCAYVCLLLHVPPNILNACV